MAVIITVTFGQADRYLEELLREVAAKQGVSVSAVVRAACREWMEKNGYLPKEEVPGRV